MAPGIDAMLWPYATGTPKEQFALSGPDGGAMAVVGLRLAQGR